ncbi:hypothetical protein [Paraburkholderia sp. 32]|uniref:hypothetical protein n=1 Tax=Paraburkholderia sp. 32 TaxID=2991057 RepID=UPI003D1DF264
MMMGQLAAAMAMDRTTLTPNLKPLERDGLVEIVSSEARRAKQTIISPVDIVRYEEVLPLWKGVQERFESAYGSPSAARLRDSLRNVLQAGFEPWADTPSDVGRQRLHYPTDECTTLLGAFASI